MNADGILDRSAWTIADANDAFLYYDRNRNHRIDGSHELFGDRTPLPGGRVALNGFEALQAHDRNRDGVISAKDGVWGMLRLWVDRNHDGSMSHDESFALGEKNIISIDVVAKAMTEEHNYGLDPSGNRHFMQGVYAARDRNTSIVRAVHDIVFQVQAR